MHTRKRTIYTRKSESSSLRVTFKHHVYVPHFVYIRRICSYFYIAPCDSLCSLLLAFMDGFYKIFKDKLFI